LVPEAAKFSPEIIPYCGFVAGNRFDVDQLARERDGVHGGENSRGERRGSQKQGSEARLQKSDLWQGTLLILYASFLLHHSDL